MIVARLSQLSAVLRRQLRFYAAVMRHPRTPRVSRWCLALAVGYLLAPIDLIPDFLPIIGQLDDLVIVPALVAMAFCLVPREVSAQCRQRLASSSGSRD